jgi:hypothetical protein
MELKEVDLGYFYHISYGRWVYVLAKDIDFLEKNLPGISKKINSFRHFHGKNNATFDSEKSIAEAMLEAEKFIPALGTGISYTCRECNQKTPKEFVFYIRTRKV